jgi:hypothetical protein
MRNARRPTDHADLAELGHVSRTRVCQILMLTNLAPAIQETLLFLPKTLNGLDRITESRFRGTFQLLSFRRHHSERGQ